MPNAALPNVSMAAAVDIGEVDSPALGPHVRDKQDVGRRLALVVVIVQFCFENKKFPIQN